MVFKSDGSIQMHSGPKRGVILTKNLKHGTYELTTKILTIKWDVNGVERYNIKFMDKHVFILTVRENGKKIIQTFSRVVDEEVVEEKE